MGLFSKKQVQEVAEFGYQDAVDYLRDLEQTDYNKILKVVGIYRDADKGVKKVLNIKPEPVEEGFTDEELNDLFLVDEPTPKVKITKTPKPAKKGKGEN